MDNKTLSKMESRFGHDFSQVRVHTEDRAARTAEAIGAKAYTIGRDVVFAPGAYQPHTAAGQRLLAHELAHVVQQGRRDNRQYASLESEAERQANGVTGEVDRKRAPAPLPTPLQPRLQCYRVPGSLACSELVGWLNSNSPYAPEWAQTACNYSFEGGVQTQPSTSGGQVSIRVRGHKGSKVSVSCPVDSPSWNPTKRANRDAEVAAWNTMLTALNTHEADHRAIGRTWRATLESRFQAVDFTVTAPTQAEAQQLAVERISAMQSQWTADAQAAQDAIDPWRGAILTCP